MTGTFDVLATSCLSDGSAWASGDTRTQGGPPMPAVWHYAAQQRITESAEGAASAR